MPYDSKVYYTSTGSEQTVAVTFPYLDTTHVLISFWNPATEIYDLQNAATYSWPTTASITLTNPDTTADGIMVWRSTGTEPLVTFTNASLLNEDDQNKAALQAVYLIEEGADLLAQTVVSVGGITTINTRVAGTFYMNGGQGAINVGVKGFLQIPFACTIVKAYLLADQTGSMVVDIWKDTYANFPPTNADSICGANPLTISSGVKDFDATLTSWTIAIAQDDILAFNVDSCTTIVTASLILVLNKTGA